MLAQTEKKKLDKIMSSSRRIEALKDADPALKVRDMWTAARLLIIILYAVSLHVGSRFIPFLVLQAATDTDLWKAWIQSYVARLIEDVPGTTPNWSSDSVDLPSFAAERVAQMRASNPSFILRNWVAQEAIKDAETGDYNAVSTSVQNL